MSKRIVQNKGLLLTGALLMVFTIYNEGLAGQDISKLLEKATAKGFVRVIVGLQLPTPFIPEGAHASSVAVERQRQAIMESRARFFNMLSGLAAGEYEQYAQWDFLPYVALKAKALALQRLADSQLVTNIQEDSEEGPHLASTTAHIGADATWEGGFGGLGWTVGILDTGIDRDHPFLNGRIVYEACYSSTGGDPNRVSLCPNGTASQTGLGSADAETAQCWATPGNTGTQNICDHGSHVAGIAAGRDASPYAGAIPPGCAGNLDCFSGVAPEANIIAIKVFHRKNDCNDDGTANDPCVKTYPSDQISALNDIYNWRTHWNISSVNMSLGGGAYWDYCDTDARKAAIDQLRASGIATVISSGNDGWTDGLGAPGCISTAVTVGAVYDGNPCNTIDEVTYNMHWTVDLLAVGRCVDSSVPDDDWGAGWGGTSMAAPQVTGAFAMIKAINPAMTVDEIENLLKDTGVLVRDTRPANAATGQVNPAQGYVKPRIQLDAAVASLTQADLRVFKDCKPDQPLLVGGTATCTISVQNLGPDPAIGVMAVDEYLSNGNFTFGAVTTTAGTCTTTSNPQNRSGTVTCDLGGILDGATITIRVPVTANDPEDINDRVTVTSITPDPDSNNNVAQDSVTFIKAADLEVTKDCKPDEPMDAGQVGTCYIWVRNWGPSTAANVTLEDVHVSNGTFDFGTVTTTSGSCTPSSNPQAGSGTVNCALGNLTSGDVVEIVVPLLPTEEMNINDQATASSETYDPNTANNSARDGVGVKPVADLSLTKAADPKPVLAGSQLTYDLTVTNYGPSSAVNVVIEDVLPAGVTIESVTSPDGTCNAGVPGNGSLPTTCAVDSLAPNASATMQIVVMVKPQVLGTLGNNAWVFSDVFDPDNSDNLATTASTVTGNANLAISKTDNPDPVLAGNTLTYGITIANGGPSTAIDVKLEDALPNEVSFVTYTVSNGSGTCVALQGSTTVQCDLNDLDPGQFVTVFIEVLVNSAVPHGTTISDTATASSSTPDLDPTDNTITEDTTVNAEADLVITKEASYLSDNPAANIAYTLLVSNSGPSDALNVVVVDELPLTPKKVVYVMDSGNGACTYDKGTHDVTCNFGTLPAGEAVSVDIEVKALGSVGRITNIAKVSTSTHDGVSSNNSASKEILVKGSTQNKK